MLSQSFSVFPGGHLQAARHGSVEALSCPVIVWAPWAPYSPVVTQGADSPDSSNFNGTMRGSLYVSSGNVGERLRLCRGLRVMVTVMKQPQRLLCLSESPCFEGTDNSQFPGRR